MLARNILVVLTAVVAAVATPVLDLEKRNPCGSTQQLECCDSILSGIGIGCGKSTPFVYKI
jgi:hypothetical protein